MCIMSWSSLSSTAADIAHSVGIEQRRLPGADWQFMHDGKHASTLHHDKDATKFE